jgi:zinc transport system substrate-binding protein
MARTGRAARTAASLAAVLLLAAACETPTGDADDPAGSGTPQEAGEPVGAGEGGLLVAASVFPLAWLATEIAPAAEVRLLGSGGQDPHDLELSPAERSAIEDADVVLHMGAVGLQPQVERAVAGATGEIVAAAEVVGPRALRPIDDEHPDAGSGATDPAGAVDPHLWLSPARWGEVAEAVGEALAAADPGAAAAHTERAAAVRDELGAIEAEIDARLSDCAHRIALVGHEAGGYLLEPRGLEQEGISPTGGHGAASPQRLAELADLVEDAGLSAVFAEPVEGRDLAEALAAEADATVYEVDPLETVPEGARQRDYPELLLEQVDTFATGLRCDA